jgi:hypothetical protein
MMGTTENGEQWISRVKAARRLGCQPRAILCLARAGHLTSRKLPGCNPLYLVTDIDRLARESTRAVTPSAVAGTGPNPRGRPRAKVVPAMQAAG